jgi:hypothetical protein
MNLPFAAEAENFRTELRQFMADVPSQGLLYASLGDLAVKHSAALAAAVVANPGKNWEEISCNFIDLKNSRD